MLVSGQSTSIKPPSSEKKPIELTFRTPVLPRNRKFWAAGGRAVCAPDLLRWFAPPPSAAATRWATASDAIAHESGDALKSDAKRVPSAGDSSLGIGSGSPSGPRPRQPLASTENNRVQDGGPLPEKKSMTAKRGRDTEGPDTKASVSKGQENEPYSLFDRGSNASLLTAEEVHAVRTKLAKRKEDPQLTISERQMRHITAGDRHGGGHLAGARSSEWTSQFPTSWDEGMIRKAAKAVIKCPKEVRPSKSVPDRWVYTGSHQGVRMKVIVSDADEVITAYPLN